MTLSEESLQELQWWCDNIENVDYKICIPNSKIDITLYADASNDGWGTVMGTSKTGADGLRLRPTTILTIYSREYSVHIQVYSDNTTAVNYTNCMRGTQSMECHSVAKTIWLFCMERKIWLSAAHIPGKDSITADRESRVFSDNKEWMLSTHLFQEIVATWGEPTIDLFASRLNKQVACYVLRGNQIQKRLMWMHFQSVGMIICFMLFPHLV